MSVIPPTLPNPRARERFVDLARVCLFSVPVAGIVFGSVSGGIKNPNDELTANASLILAGLIPLTGILSGVAALVGTVWHGRKGILAPALCSLGLWLTFVFLFVVPSYRSHQEPSHPQQTPSVHRPSAAVLRDDDLALSLDLPEGYESYSAESSLPGYRYIYRKTEIAQPNRLFAIKPLSLVIPKGLYLKSTDLPRGSEATIVWFSWRGLDVNGARIPEKIPSGDYVTFNLRIPLQKQAIILTFGGPAAADAEMRAVAGEVLASLEGETNW